MKKDKVLILTALPFKINGNQSLPRFIKMFLDKDFTTNLYTSAISKNILNDPNFEIVSIPSLHEWLLNIKKTKNIPKKLNQTTNMKQNKFFKIKSDDVLPPFGALNIKTAVSKWFLFIIYIIDNLLLFLYLLILKNKFIKSFDLIIGYECGYTHAAKLLSKIFHKKYISKYQGTVLKSVSHNLTTARIFFPYNYFGINKSDLCIMVDDGTDGEFYARARGCKNIYFQPHGVATEVYDNIDKKLFDFTDYENKFIIFNNASGSNWKRVDRIVRSLQYLPSEIKNKIIILSTYNGPDKQELNWYTQQIKVDSCVEFLENIDYITSNFLIRNSNLPFQDLK